MVLIVNDTVKIMQKMYANNDEKDCELFPKRCIAVNDQFCHLFFHQFLLVHSVLDCEFVHQSDHYSLWFLDRRNDGSLTNRRYLKKIEHILWWKLKLNLKNYQR